MNKVLCSLSSESGQRQENFWQWIEQEVRSWVAGLAEKVEKHVQNIETPLKVAVMGCVVNGPGEAREADLGLAGGNGVGIIFKKGKIFRKVPEAELLEVFIAELDKMVAEKKQEK